MLFVRDADYLKPSSQQALTVLLTVSPSINISVSFRPAAGWPYTIHPLFSKHLGQSISVAGVIACHPRCQIYGRPVHRAAKYWNVF